jgi:hypothetical protein
MGILTKTKRTEVLTQADVNDGLVAIMRGNEPTILDYNILQLQRGKDSNGVKLEPAYALQTIRSKQAKSQPFDRVTLYDEGDFYRGFFLSAIDFPIVIDSRDRKTPKLVEKYGAIFGLDRESQRELNQFYIKKEYQRFVRSLFHL